MAKLSSRGRKELLRGVRVTPDGRARVSVAYMDDGKILQKVQTRNDSPYSGRSGYWLPGNWRVVGKHDGAEPYRDILVKRGYTIDDVHAVQPVHGS